MKKILLSILLVAIVNCSFAQIRIGPEIGFTYGGINREVENFSTVNTSRPGFRAGAVVDLPALENVSLQTGIFFNNQSTVSTIGTSVGGLFTYEYEQTLKVNYLKVPLNLVYKVNDNDKGKLFVGAGPYFGYVIGGSSNIDVIRNENLETLLNSLLGLGGLGGLGNLGNLGGLLGNNNFLGEQLNGLLAPFDEVQEGEQKIKTGTDSAAHVRPLDIGLNVQIGYELPSGFIVRGQYSVGLTNTAPLANNSQRNWNASLSLAYIIGFNKKAKND